MAVGMTQKLKTYSALVVATRCKIARINRGLDVKEVSQITNIPYYAIVEIEDATAKVVDLQYICFLAQLYGVSVDFLCGLKEEEIKRVSLEEQEAIEWGILQKKIKQIPIIV